LSDPSGGAGFSKIEEKQRRIKKEKKKKKKKFFGPNSI